MLIYIPIKFLVCIDDDDALFVHTQHYYLLQFPSVKSRVEPICKIPNHNHGSSLVAITSFIIISVSPENGVNFPIRHILFRHLQYL
jgi:hypothetical protein